MKKITLLLTGTLIFASVVMAQTATEDDGVVINGVKWATRNVDMPGTFAENSESSGMFYQWNRKIGWSSTNPRVNSDGSTTWDSSLPSGTVWEKNNDPSPIGWRVPTLKEINSLLDEKKVKSEWITTEDGINGRKFTDIITGNNIFLPAAGLRHFSPAGALTDVGLNARYWSSIPFSGSMAYFLYFKKNDVGESGNGMFYIAYNVRSVKDTDNTTNINEIENTKEKTIVAFFSIMGVQLRKEPERGLYIILFGNGKAEKTLK